MKTLTISAIAIAFAGAAYADQDAYITQVGDGHLGLNYSENTSDANRTSATQVIMQSAPTRSIPNEGRFGGSFEAVNLSRGGGAGTASNSAYAYQIDSRADNQFNGDLGEVQMTSLNFQSGAGNTAIAVQLETTSGPAAGRPSYTSQIIQEGNNNVGVNWQTDGGNALAGVSLASISAPSIQLAPMAGSPSSPFVPTTGFYSGSTFSVGN